MLEIYGAPAVCRHHNEHSSEGLVYAVKVVVWGLSLNQIKLPFGVKSRLKGKKLPAQKRKDEHNDYQENCESTHIF